MGNTYYKMNNIKYLSIIAFIFFSNINVSAQTFNIKDFGAKADDKTINTEFIQTAINACFNNGGGTVYIPAGIFITGTIELKSNVNLHLESGSELKGSQDLRHYKSYETKDFPTSHFGIIYAHKANNVSITGQGTINGNEEVFFDWTQAKKIEWGGTKFTRQKGNYRAVASGIDDGPVVPKDRPRQMVIFSECTNVLVRDVHLIKSPFWTLHFADCDGVLVSGIKIWTSLDTPNSDGLDITSSSNVFVSDCDIKTGDDAIAITGYAHHFELPGYYNRRHPSNNITITNCNLQSRSSGIRIGFLDQNTIRYINISNINITNSNRGIGIFVRDEGSVENVMISQVNIETRLHTGDWWGNGEPIHVSAVRGNADVPLGHIKNVTFRDINCIGENGILIFGSEENRIQNLQFENLKFNFKESQLNNVAGGNVDLRGAMGDKTLFSHDIPAFHAQYVDNLSLDNFQISWEYGKRKYFTNGIYIKEFNNLQLYKIQVESAPSNALLPSVLLENGEYLKTDLKLKNQSLKNIRNK